MATDVSEHMVLHGTPKMWGTNFLAPTHIGELNEQTWEDNGEK